MVYGNSLRILHSLLALCMIGQLALGELMDVPGKHSNEQEQAATVVTTLAFAHEHVATTGEGAVTEESWMFELHEGLGLAIVALILTRIAMAFSSVPGAHWRNLFPWLSADGRQTLQNEVVAQASGWKQGKLAAPEDGESVARSVHGLMLLTVLAMAATGVGLFLGWNEHGQQTAMVHTVGEVHEAFAGLVETLLALHVIAVVLHIRGGHPIINRIRPFAQ